MVVRIRLARWGAKNNPFYGIVVANHRAPRDGKHLERVGTYNPIADQKGVKHVEMNISRIKYWLGVGAQPSERVAWLLSKVDLIPPTPTQLQNQGHVSSNDAKTWDVELRDEKGARLGTLSGKEARELLSDTSLAEQLPKDEVYQEPPKHRLIHKNIDLSGRAVPKAPLTPEERLRILQTFTGIR
ncbi:ribosomal protein S16 domain-containing protein [Gaertneriomyces semiglobifer]|nr:ribosomal protein S16 domain-containing protein [Gaertneriomyces semiglobifer]